MSGNTDTPSFLDEDYETGSIDSKPLLAVTEMNTAMSLVVEFTEPLPREVDTEYGTQQVFSVEALEDAPVPVADDDPDSTVQESDQYEIMTSAKSFLADVQEIARNNGDTLEGVAVEITREAAGQYAGYNVEEVSE
jgi:hypothetical protein